MAPERTGGDDNKVGKKGRPDGNDFNCIPKGFKD